MGLAHHLGHPEVTSSKRADTDTETDCEGGEGMPSNRGVRFKDVDPTPSKER